MAELKIYDGEQWVKMGELDIPPEMMDDFNAGRLDARSLLTDLLTALPTPAPALVCRYCGSTLEVYWDGVPQNAVWIECADLGNNACKASWQTDGKPLTDQKGTPIDD